MSVGKIEADLSGEVIDPPRPWLRPKPAFAGFRYPPEVIVVAVRCICGSTVYRDVEERMVVRGVEVDRLTMYRWVQRFTPLFAAGGDTGFATRSARAGRLLRR